MWRWETRDAPAPELRKGAPPPEPRRGYCGLSGTPFTFTAQWCVLHIAWRRPERQYFDTVWAGGGL